MLRSYVDCQRFSGIIAVGVALDLGLVGFYSCVYVWKKVY